MDMDRPYFTYSKFLFYFYAPYYKLKHFFSDKSSSNNFQLNGCLIDSVHGGGREFIFQADYRPTLSNRDVLNARCFTFRNWLTVGYCLEFVFLQIFIIFIHWKSIIAVVFLVYVFNTKLNNTLQGRK